jgi:hypothetical protein
MDIDHSRQRIGCNDILSYTVAGIRDELIRAAKKHIIADDDELSAFFFEEIFIIRWKTIPLHRFLAKYV